MISKVHACVYVCVCVWISAGEVISENVEDATEAGYHAERDDVINEEDAVAAVGAKGKNEVQLV